MIGKKIIYYTNHNWDQHPFYAVPDKGFTACGSESTLKLGSKFPIAEADPVI